MSVVLKVLVVVNGLYFAVGGLVFMFNPVYAAGLYALAPEGSHGLSAVRSDLSGILLGIGVITFCGLWRKQAVWFLPVAVLMAGVAMGRLVGFAFDGVDWRSQSVFVIEVVIVALMIWAFRRLSAEWSAAA